MDKSAVKQWVDENIERLQAEMGLPHWRLQILYESIEAREGGFQPVATVRFKPEYERACITVNFDEVESESTLEEHLKHELAHVVHAPFEIPYEIVKAIVTDEQLSAINKAWITAEEMTVRNIERLLHAQAKLQKTEQEGAP